MRLRNEIYVSRMILLYRDDDTIARNKGVSYMSFFRKGPMLKKGKMCRCGFERVPFVICGMLVRI